MSKKLKDLSKILEVMANELKEINLDIFGDPLPINKKSESLKGKKPKKRPITQEEMDWIDEHLIWVEDFEQWVEWDYYRLRDGVRVNQQKRRTLRHGAYFWKVDVLLGDFSSPIGAKPDNQGYFKFCPNDAIFLKKGEKMRNLKIHKIRFFKLHGRHPSNGYSVDHDNRNTMDNRGHNLREKSAVEQAKNKGPIRVSTQEDMIIDLF